MNKQKEFERKQTQILENSNYGIIPCKEDCVQDLIKQCMDVMRKTMNDDIQFCRTLEWLISLNTNYIEPIILKFGNSYGIVGIDKKEIMKVFRMSRNIHQEKLIGRRN